MRNQGSCSGALEAMQQRFHRSDGFVSSMEPISDEIVERNIAGFISDMYTLG